MDISQLIKTGNYVDEFKKHKLVYRKYPDLDLMVVKRRYGLPHSDSDPWLNYCRGLVIDYVNHSIVFCPPIKSKEIRTIDDFAQINDTYTELIDGTMINLFYHGPSEQWVTSTRSNIGCNNKWSGDMNFKQMFEDCSNKLNYDLLNHGYTYSFVMRHKKNRIITPVPSNQLYLIEVRQGTSILPLPECPEQSYYVNKEIRQESLSRDMLPDLYKGFTTTKDGIRYRWLTPECKFIEMIKPNTNNPCLNYLTLRKSGHLSNYLKLFPEERFNHNKYRNQVHELSTSLHHYYTNVFIHKEIEKNEIPFALRPFIYDLHGIYLKEKEGISWNHVKQYIYDLEPKRLCFALNKF